MNLHTVNPAILGFQLATAATIALALGFGAAMYAPLARAAAGDANEQTMVDCMLPEQIQRLNNNVMNMGARHPIRTTRADCHLRGGEYHDADHTAKVHHKVHHATKTVNPTPTITK